MGVLLQSVPVLRAKGGDREGGRGGDGDGAGAEAPAPLAVCRHASSALLALCLLTDVCRGAIWKRNQRKRKAQDELAARPARTPAQRKREAAAKRKSRKAIRLGAGHRARGVSIVDAVTTEGSACQGVMNRRLCALFEYRGPDDAVVAGSASARRRSGPLRRRRRLLETRRRVCGLCERNG